MFGRDIVGVLARTAEIELSDAKKPVKSSGKPRVALIPKS